MGKSKKSELDWQWPEIGRNEAKLGEAIRQISSPYEQDIPPICYPGTTLSKGLLGRVAKTLLSQQINSIGCHTHGKMGEGGFQNVQNMEAQAIWMVASILGGSPQTIDGYFCGGGTEANLQGLWIGREWLKQCPDPMNKGIVVLSTPLYHYSIVKAIELLDIGHSQMISCTHCGKIHLFMPDTTGSGLNLVGMNKEGEMSIIELERVFRQKYDEGFRRFLVVSTVGTCLMGSIDPIAEIGNFIRSTRNTGANFYLHVDASFAGLTVPFVKPDLPIAFSIPEVMSVTVDGDKMGQLPYPAGIFLCRKSSEKDNPGLMSLVARKVNYIRQQQDDTISGSRSCLAPVLAWFLFQKDGIKGQKEYVLDCLNGRDKLIELVRDKLPWVNRLPHSPWVNFAPMEIGIENGEIPEEIREGNGILVPYHPRHDYFPSDPSDPQSCPIVVYKICIMPHNTKKEGYFEKFVADIEQADFNWKTSH